MFSLPWDHRRGKAHEQDPLLICFQIALIHTVCVKTTHNTVQYYLWIYYVACFMCYLEVQHIIMYQPNWLSYTQFQLLFLLGSLYISLEYQTTYKEMRCSTLELEEDDTKGTSVPCRLLEYMTLRNYRKLLRRFTFWQANLSCRQGKCN